MFTDEEITAYLDQELPPKKMAAIQHGIDSGRITAAQLDTLRLNKNVLNAAFAPLMDAAPEPTMPPLRKPRFGYALAASVVLAVGVGVGASLFAPQKGWEIEVAHYQSLYVADTLSGIAPDAQQIEHQISNASTMLNLDLSAEKLSGFTPLTLRRAQVLGFEGKVLIQIAYTMNDGTPVAFCILKQQNPESQGINSSEMVGLAAATWQNSGHSFLTIGGQDQELMAEFARYLATVL